MSTHPITIIFFLLGCISISFLMSGMEAGILALNPWRMRKLSRQGNKSAKLLVRYLDNPEDFLWTTLVGNTVSAFAGFCILIFSLTQWIDIHPYAFVLLLLLTVFLFYIFGDLLPKILFRNYPSRFCQASARPFQFIATAFRPLTLLVEIVAALLLAGQQSRSYSGRLRQSREEMRRIVNEATGSVTPEEKTLINRVLDLHNQTARDVMVTMDKAVCIDLKTKSGELLEIAAKHSYSRFPVWDSLKTKEQVLGVANLKDLLYAESPNLKQTISSLTLEPLFIQEHQRLDDVMELMQNKKRRLAIVVDWRKTAIGIITIQDILKTVFGEVSL